MRYKKSFDPSRYEARSEEGKDLTSKDPRGADDLVYVFSEPIILAVNVAIATARPLLVFGPPGSGKSSLAPNVARILGWRFLAEVISSRTEAQDLLWRFDTIQRLNDAQVHQLSNDDNTYVEPGILWWAFDAESAKLTASIPESAASVSDLHKRAVVLLDEIDKADPDLPNNLLVPLGSRRFDAKDRRVEVTAERAPLIIITTNDERELSKPFLRRCIILRLPEPSKKHLISVAIEHLGPENETLYQEVADILIKIQQKAKLNNLPPPSTAEYLDTLYACLELGIGPGLDAWDLLISTTLVKHRS